VDASLPLIGVWDADFPGRNGHRLLLCLESTFEGEELTTIAQEI
jgi:hypothetical protein